MKKTMLVLAAVLALLGSAPKYAHASADGTPSTGSFTVNNNAPLAAATATGSLTVLDTASLSGVYVNIGPYIFKAGRDFAVGGTTNASAANLAAAINANANLPISASAVGTNVVSLTATDLGTLYNAYVLKTSNSGEISTSGSTMTGGQDNAVIKINNLSLRQGTDWFIQDVTSNTATSIATAINHHSVLWRLIEAQPLGSVVYLRSLVSPQAYPLATSDATDLTASGSAMTGGAAGNMSRSVCNLGIVDILPNNNYPAGCLAYLQSDPTHIQVSTKTLTGAEAASAYWLAK